MSSYITSRQSYLSADRYQLAKPRPVSSSGSGPRPECKLRPGHLQTPAGTPSDRPETQYRGGPVILLPQDESPLQDTSALHIAARICSSVEPALSLYVVFC